MPTKEPVSLYAGLSRNTFLLAAASLFADLATEMLTPILPIFLTQTLGTGGSIVGLVDGIAQAWRNVVDGFFGPLSDRLRSRKPIALIGYSLAALGKPVMGYSAVWQGVLAGRLLDRSGAGAFAAPRDALVSSSTEKRSRGRGFGLESLGENGGAFLGPILTLLLLYVLRVDIRTIFYLAFVPGLLAFALMLLVTEQQAPQPPTISAAQYATRFILEASLRCRCFQHRQLEQLVPHLADAGADGFSADHDIDLCRVQFGRRADVLSGRLAIR
ncbi:MFS transporter [Bradyrhizobium sp. STM 3562]|uniref:MFS transporter n=1 Tax=Bradyrhizobium sp. STM 3562 TaxID=578924 RepID=UPI0038905097